MAQPATPATDTSARHSAPADVCVTAAHAFVPVPVPRGAICSSVAHGASTRVCARQPRTATAAGSATRGPSATTQQAQEEPRAEGAPRAAARPVCRVCKQLFDPAANHARACRFHPSAWTGAERSKFYGQREQDGVLRRGTEYYRDCCDATSCDAPGCTFAFHKTYDDE